MTREELEFKKAQARLENIVAYQREVPCVHRIAVEQWEESTNRYNSKDFKRAETIVDIIHRQVGMRALTGGTAQIIHQLHIMRNGK